jgi:two-component system cell cycle response regulator
MADLDHFKRVNDTYGHATGDIVLKGTAEILRENLRATDVAARWGGEEFLVVLPETDLIGGEQWGERWRAGIERARFDSADGGSLEVTLSVGVARYHTRMQSPETLIAAADKALYRAKESGRNRVVVQQDDEASTGPAQDESDLAEEKPLTPDCE